MRAEKQIQYPDHRAPRMRGEFIRRHRTHKGYTQAHVARLVGMEESTYNRSEKNGAGLDSVEKLCALAQALDIDFVELVRVGCPQPDIEGQASKEALLDMIVHSVTQLRNLR